METGRKKRCRSKSCIRARKRRLASYNNTTTFPYQQHSPDQHTKRKTSLFETYIKEQNWLSEREHWRFLSALKRPLPICFRIRSPCAEKELQQLLHSEGVSIHARQPIVNGKAWQIPATIIDDYPRIRRWLASQTSQGTISRQEFVSMIPVLLLDIQSHHRVLDLCASPGSKTLQALDMLYNNKNSNNHDIEKQQGHDKSPPSGFVMANELDPSRAYVLAHRICEATARSTQMASVAVTVHNACKFPNVLAPMQRRQCTDNSSKPFDRIVCDVPCSGDGTLRKDLKVWKTWSPSYGISLHALQIRIAKRGIALLEVGGLMTYSTCSFHPIENEAVVAALLETECVQVVDCQNIRSLQGIHRRPGLTSWKVLNDDCQEQEPPRKGQKANAEWPKTLWPPVKGTTRQQLSRCIRMVPHDNDSGGFFIALLQKVKDFSHKSASATTHGDDDSTRSPPVVTVTAQSQHHKLFPVKKSVVVVDDSIVVGDHEDHNKHNGNNDVVHAFTRGPSGGTIFYLNPLLAKYLTQSPGSDKVNIVYAGAKGRLDKKLCISLSTNKTIIHNGTPEKLH